MKSVILRAQAFLVANRLHSDSLQIYFYQFVTLAVTLVISILISRSLGPEAKGLVDIYNVLTSFIVEFGLLGFGSAMLFYLANKGRPLSEIHGTSLLFSGVTAIVAIGAGWLGINLWKVIFPNLPDWAVVLAFFVAGLGYYQLIWSNLMTGLGRVVVAYKISFYLVIFSLVINLILWLNGLLSSEVVILVSAGMTFLVTLIMFFVMIKHEKRISPSVLLAKEGLKYGFIVYLGGLANIAHFRIDQIMINNMLGAESLGLYAVGVRWAEMLFLLDNAPIAASLFKISSLPEAESQKLASQVFRTQLIISGISGLLLVLLAYPLIWIMYGKAFIGSVWPLIALVPGVVAWSLSKSASGMLTYNRNMAYYPAAVATLGLLINIVLNYLFLMIFDVGILGFGIASSISYITVAVLLINRAQLLQYKK